MIYGLEVACYADYYSMPSACLATSCSPRFNKWADESWRARGTTHQRREGSGCWLGNVPLPTGERSGEGAMPLPGNFSVFELKIASFGAFWELIILLHL